MLIIVIVISMLFLFLFKMGIFRSFGWLTPTYNRHCNGMTVPMFAFLFMIRLAPISTSFNVKG